MIEQDFYVEIKQILNSAREKVYKTANLANMRQCYLTFSNFYALRSELSWTHYCMLMGVENKDEVSKEIVKVQRILSEIRMYWNFCE